MTEATAPAPSTAAPLIGAQLVGSMNVPDADTAFREASRHLGMDLKRIPDGESGARADSVQFQRAGLDRVRGLERVGPDTPGRADTRPYRVVPHRPPVDIGPLGYAEAALESYAAFTLLIAADVIAPHTRFQVSLPTPIGVTSAFFTGQGQRDVERLYERAMLAELSTIVDAIPHGDLAIQWDTATEFAILEGVPLPGQDLPQTMLDPLEGLTDRAALYAAVVPPEVQLGFHLCYGTAATALALNRPQIQPTDVAVLTAFASRLLAKSPRIINWIHLPVPVQRSDDAYFAPLAGVAWPIETELYLGLVHGQDGVPGATGRIRAARTAISEFGIGSECGFRRSAAAPAAVLLGLHAAVLAAD